MEGQHPNGFAFSGQWWQQLPGTKNPATNPSTTGVVIYVEDAPNVLIEVDIQ